MLSLDARKDLLNDPNLSSIRAHGSITRRTVRSLIAGKNSQFSDGVKKISAITDPIQVRRYLKHENIDYEPPARAPPRYQQGEFDFDDTDYHKMGCRSVAAK